MDRGKEGCLGPTRGSVEQEAQLSQRKRASQHRSLTRGQSTLGLRLGQDQGYNYGQDQVGVVFFIFALSHFTPFSSPSRQWVCKRTHKRYSGKFFTTFTTTQLILQKHKFAKKNNSYQNDNISNISCYLDYKHSLNIQRRILQKIPRSAPEADDFKIQSVLSCSQMQLAKCS